ncbi:MAG: hypothetical protein BRD26_06870 [Bacteroidetes bacterium QH_1_64_81]|nr:MAG: hypothetical protein BRD26_06870 [Bacteroidetes bacterium QH_1_64_81]
MPYRVRSVILGVLSLLLFGPASSAAQSGPPAAEASVVYTGEMVGGAVGAGWTRTSCTSTTST